MSIAEFAHKHHACPAGYEWALRNCETMQDVWDKAPISILVWVASRPGVIDSHEVELKYSELARKRTDIVSHQLCAIWETYGEEHCAAFIRSLKPRF